MEKIMNDKKENQLDNNESSTKRVLHRVAKRRQRVRNKILEIATKRFAIEGPDNVKLEGIADEADISRATLYSHFASKDEIIYEIIKPVLEEIIQKYEMIIKDLDKLSTGEIFDELSDFYIHLWENYELALLLAQKILEKKPYNLLPLYDRMLELKRKILQKFEKEKKLKFPIDNTYDIILSTLVPLLKNIAPLQNGKKLFKSTLKNMLFH
ncbi:MAG: TetR/AcrR family transcriptional regulator [Leptospiraceae bacterium]|nr:TetR/AcrR family transcriptional regulator [Leptospiraceae bacterium]MDW7975037.1 TetR/AcrR family transcriptional regulator [Leptospiraceae bacterium]